MMKRRSTTMDRIDEQILHLLRENARITSSDIP
ncbi:AsnC family transcriptional regulator [Brevibacillus sp. Leaf182]